MSKAIRVKIDVQRECLSYLKKYPKPSWKHNQQNLVRYCLKLLSAIDIDDLKFELKLIVALAEINKKLRQAHNQRISTVICRLFYFGLVSPVDSGKFKIVIEDALCRLMGRLLLSIKIRRHSDAGLTLPFVSYASVKRGDIRTHYNISVREQELMVNSILAAEGWRSGLSVLIFSKVKNSEKFVLSMDVVNRILNFVPKIMDKDENKNKDLIFSKIENSGKVVLSMDVVNRILNFVPKIMNKDENKDIDIINKANERLQIVRAKRDWKNGLSTLNLYRAEKSKKRLSKDVVDHLLGYIKDAVSVTKAETVANKIERKFLRTCR